MNINGTCIYSTIDSEGPIYVYENRTSRILSFDGKIYQSAMKLNDVNGLTLGYTQAMMTSLIFIPLLKTVTLMGLGAGSMVKNLLKNFSEVKIHAVECREAVVKIARDYFYLPDTDRLEIYIDDAANYINNSQNKSDIIFSDLFNSGGMEAKQVQLSYLRNCKNALNNQGVLVLNVWHTSLSLRVELCELLVNEFENRVLSFEVEGGNTIILAFKNDIPKINFEELAINNKWVAEKIKPQMEQYFK